MELNLRGHFKPGKAFISVDLKEPGDGPSPSEPSAAGHRRFKRI
jgi:hypothetical protein